MKKTIYILVLLMLICIGGLYAKRKLCDLKYRLDRDNGEVMQNDQKEKISGGPYQGKRMKTIYFTSSRFSVSSFVSFSYNNDIPSGL